jgi:hypothetical protein
MFIFSFIAAMTILPPCSDASGSWNNEDYGPAVVAGQCVAYDGVVERVEPLAGTKLENLSWNWSE